MRALAKIAVAALLMLTCAHASAQDVTRVRVWHAYQRDDNSIGWRCPSEPVEDYVKKGGDIADTIGRKCLCNSLVANVGLPQIHRNGEIEGTLITSGDDAARVARFSPDGATQYSAADVIKRLLDITDVPNPGSTR